jgi:hypothetical protein
MASRGGSRRRHRSRRHRRGGNPVLSQAAVPFGLFALSNYLGTGKKHRGTRKGGRRKNARHAYMTKRGKKFF